MHILIGILAFLIIIELLILLINFSVKTFLPSEKVEIKINNNKQILAKQDATLLETLYENQIYIPSACGGKGTCGYCKIQAKNSGKPLSTEVEFLSKDEQNTGYRLACQLKPRKNMEITIPEAYLNATTFKYEVVSNISKTSDINEITFKYHTGDKLKFYAGQYIQVKIPTNKEEIVFRAYSLASSETNNDTFSLLVKLIPNGLGSTYLHSLKTGDIIEFTGPYGEWRIDYENQNSELLLIGGGSGLAPLRSIVLSMLQYNSDKPISFYYGAKTPDDLIDLQLFSKLDEKHTDFTFVPSVDSDPTNTWQQEKGFIHTVFTKKYKKQKQKAQVFLCGPPPMIEAVLDEIKFKEIKQSEIFYDKF